MADERDEWLDQDAAERLLRGEPVDAADDHAREQARRLTEALEAVRAPHPLPSGELPGEEAALAAFREAREARGTRDARAGGSGARPAVATSGADLGAVRLKPRPRQVRWARPARWGLAVSLAGLAVGGVAVAAGTGVLPAFGGDPEPQPTATASGDVTPGPLVSREPNGGHRSATPGGPARSGPPAGPGGTPPSAPSRPGSSPDGGTFGPGTPEPARPGAGGDNVSAGAGGGGTGAGGGGDEDRDDRATWYTWAVQACSDHREGTIEGDRRRRLESAARGGDKVKRFCDKLLAGAGLPQPGGAGDATGAGGAAGGPGTGGSGGGKGTGGNGTGDRDAGGKGAAGQVTGGKEQGAKGNGTAGRVVPHGAAPAVSRTALRPAAPASVAPTGLVR
ncbi:hypothetical protein ACLGI4_10615 [Streptomyces sp. HMX112]|uniref:hypothetical protein n=1 Tax=Streptomyces sp. HMX112 TaxID=3390850 RepID=UPI003A811CB7